MPKILLDLPLFPSQICNVYEALALFCIEIRWGLTKIYILEISKGTVIRIPKSFHSCESRNFACTSAVLTSQHPISLLALQHLFPSISRPSITVVFEA